MNQTVPNIITGVPANPPESEATGLPGIRRWATVYWLVAGVFVVVVGLLAALSKLFS